MNNDLSNQCGEERTMQQGSSASMETIRSASPSTGAKRFGIFLIIFSIIYFYGCSGYIHRGIYDSELLIDKSLMPPGWEVAEYFRSYDEFQQGEISGAYISFYYSSTDYFVRSGQNVYRYKNESDAKYYFSIISTYDFQKTFYKISSWETPSEFKTASLEANEWRFACAYDNFAFFTNQGKVQRICTFLGRYSEFITEFTITTEADGNIFISINEVSSLLNSIDQKIINKLNDK